jgi:hypothetical protein
MTLQTELKLWLPVPLSQEQKASLGEKMSEVELKINKKEADKKATTSRLGDEIKELEAELYAYAKQFEDNSEEVEVDCTVEFNKPEKGFKTITRTDTGKVARTEKMSEWEVKAIEQPDLFEQEQKEEADKAQKQLHDMYLAKFGFDPLDYVGPQENIDESDYFIAAEYEVAKAELEDETFTEERFEEVKGCLFVLMGEEEFGKLKADGKGKQIGMWNCNDLYSWFIFSPLPVAAEAVEDDGLPVYKFDPEMMSEDDINESYSLDTLEKNRIRGLFEFENKAYVNVGERLKSTTESILAYELKPLESYTGEPHTFETNVDHEGQEITYMKHQFVLTNPIKIKFATLLAEDVAKAEAVEEKPEDFQEEFTEYQLPEKES